MTCCASSHIPQRCLLLRETPDLMNLGLKPIHKFSGTELEQYQERKIENQEAKNPKDEKRCFHGHQKSTNFRRCQSCKQNESEVRGWLEIL
jgi:hypothetical protein